MSSNCLGAGAVPLGRTLGTSDREHEFFDFLQMCLGSPVGSISTSMVEQSTEIIPRFLFLG